MKVVVIADQSRYEKFMPDSAFAKECEKVYAGRATTADELKNLAPDAEVIFADAISVVDADMINALPNLKMIHSEGVAFDKIDVKTAKEKGIFVCNNKGANAGAVAEMAVYLMLGLLRNAVEGHEAVIAGQQIKMKETLMIKGITELAECKVGLVGMGDIARETARRLTAFGCDLYYFNRSQKPDLEEQFGIKYLPLEELVKTCDIVSLHMAVTPETKEIVNAEFLSKMKPSAYLVNTARGDLVDNEALRKVLIEGDIAGAGFDTIAPEPVQADNPLVALPADTKAKVLYAPHLGGITTGTFRRCHKHMWENAERISKGERPDNIVNG